MGMIGIKPSAKKSFGGFVRYLIGSALLFFTLWNGPFTTFFERTGDWFEVTFSNTAIIYNLIVFAGGGKRFMMTLTAIAIIIFIIGSPKTHLPKGGK